MLKILLRKEVNRRGLGRMGVQLLVGALERQAAAASASPAAAELGNVVINTCYNGDSNVRTLIECNGLPPLLQLLRARDLDVVQSVLGALQGICFVPFGRQHVRADFEVCACGGCMCVCVRIVLCCVMSCLSSPNPLFFTFPPLPTIAHCPPQTLQIMAYHLSSPDADVRARSVGCLHNLSADAVSLSLLRQAGCLPPVVALLRDPSPELCRAAAGIVQNTVGI